MKFCFFELINIIKNLFIILIFDLIYHIIYEFLDTRIKLINLYNKFDNYFDV